MSGPHLLALAERCANALDSDRDVDAEIACLIGRPLGNIDHWLHGDDISYKPTAYGYYAAVLPDGSTSEGFQSLEYTASVDAALKLVPKGMWVEGSLASPSMIEIHAAGIYDPIAIGTARSPALAICAAALRAQAHAKPHPPIAGGDCGHDPSVGDPA